MSFLSKLHPIKWGQDIKYSVWGKEIIFSLHEYSEKITNEIISFPYNLLYNECYILFN
jgi:hypothetical protein